MRIGGIKRLISGQEVFDVPIGNTYKCKKCHKLITEHIWVGNGWRGHVERMHRQRRGWKDDKIIRTCSDTNCEINHENECNGELKLIKEGRDSQYKKKITQSINDQVKKIMK